LPADHPYDVMASQLGRGVQRLPGGFSRFDSPLMPAARVAPTVSSVVNRLFANLDPQPYDIMAGQLRSGVQRLPAEFSPLASPILESPLPTARADRGLSSVASDRAVDRLFAALAPQSITSPLSDWGEVSREEEQSELGDKLPAAADQVQTAS
jgi:hypothetical protein